MQVDGGTSPRLDDTLSLTRMADDGTSGKELQVNAVKQMRFLISKSIGWRNLGRILARIREDMVEFDLKDLDIATNRNKEI